MSAGTPFEPFSDDVYFGERIGLVGSNGTGKTQLLDILADPCRATTGSVTYGPRTSVGRFTQVDDRPDVAGRTRAPPRPAARLSPGAAGPPLTSGRRG